MKYFTEICGYKVDGILHDPTHILVHDQSGLEFDSDKKYWRPEGMQYPRKPPTGKKAKVWRGVKESPIWEYLFLKSPSF
jgi:hypothetical protein